MQRRYHPWSDESTDRVVEGIAIGVGVALLLKLADWSIEQLRNAMEPKP